MTPGDELDDLLDTLIGPSHRTEGFDAFEVRGLRDGKPGSTILRFPARQWVETIPVSPSDFTPDAGSVSDPTRGTPLTPTPPLRPEGLSPNVLTVAEVGARFSCARTVVFRLLRNGDLDRADLPSRGTLVTLASVERYERMQHVVPRRRKGSGTVDLVARRAALEERRAKLNGRKPGR